MNDNPDPARGLNAAAVILRASFAVICLFGPVLTLSLLWHFNPLFVETRLYEPFTGLTGGMIRDASDAGAILTAGQKAGIARYYLWRSAAECGAQFWNSLAPGTGIAAILSATAIALYLFYKKRKRVTPRVGTLKLPALTSTIFGVVSTGLGLAIMFDWRALVFALCATIAFTTGFPLARPIVENLGFSDRRRGVLTAMVAIVSLSGVGHILIPPVMLGFVAWALAPESAKLRNAAIAAGRVLALTGSFVTFGVIYHSLKPIYLSQGTARLVNQPGLYDMEIDTVGDRLIVANQRSMFTNACLVVDLADSTSPPIEFLIPSAEVEHIAMNTRDRRIYHIERTSNALQIFDADTLRMLDSKNLPFDFSRYGSVFLSYSESEKTLVGIWEEGRIAAIRMEPFAFLTAEIEKRANPLCSEHEDIVYVASEGKGLYAMQLGTLEVLHRAARGPGLMVLSPIRERMYVADQSLFPPGNKVWVYSIPALKLLGQIHMDWLARGMAVDEERGLLMVASYLTGYMRIIDTETGKTLRRIYVGKRCRALVLDTKRRRAYITLALDGLVMAGY